MYNLNETDQTYIYVSRGRSRSLQGRGHTCTVKREKIQIIRIKIIRIKIIRITLISLYIMTALIVNQNSVLTPASSEVVYTGVKLALPTACMYTHIVGSTSSNFIIHTCHRSGTFTVVLTTLEDARVVGKLERETDGLIKSNTCVQ